MIQRQLALLFAAVFFISLSLNGCSSSSEPELTDDGPQEPEQVSFADWERPENCELGTMPVIGEADCQRVGSVCPAGDWPASIPEAEQVIYVQPGAEGDGSSKTSAIGKISDAVEIAEDGAVIVLSKGVHEDNIILEKSLKILGACPVGTTVRGKTSMGGMITNLNSDSALTGPVSDQGEMLAILYLKGALEVSIRDLMFTGDNYGVVIDGTSPTKVNLEALVFNELMGSSIYAQGELAEIKASSITVQNTRVQQDLDQGKGIRVYDSILEIERSFFENNYHTGVTCDGKKGSSVQAKLYVKDSVFIDGQPSPPGARHSGYGGSAIMVWKCDATVEKVLSDNNSFYGVGLINTTEIPAVMVVKDFIARNTNPTPEYRTSDKYPWADTEAGFGILVWGGEAYIDGALLENNSSADILVMESAYPCDTITFESCSSTFAVLENITSRAVQMDTSGHFGNGVVIMDGAEALVSKASFDQAYTAGIMVIDALRRNGSGDTLALFTDVQVSNVVASDYSDEASGLETFGDGIVVANGALASFSRFKVSEVERVGILLNGEYDWEEIESQFGKRDLVSKQAVERSKRDKKGKRDAVLSLGSVEKAKIGINNQMMTDELGKRDSVEELSSDVSTSETESSYSTDAIAIPTFSVLDKDFMEAAFGAQLDEQAQ